MKKFALLGLSAVLLGCGVVEVRLIPPTLENLQNQATYCTDRDTIVDFKFNKTGLLTKLEVWITDDNPAITDPSTATGAGSDKSVQTFDLGNNTFKGYVVLDSNGVPGIQREGVGGQAITVTPTGNKRVWVRGYNGGETKGFVKSSTVLSPSSGVSCDPIFPYDTP